MKLIYTEQALLSLTEALEFIAPKLSYKKLVEIRDEILDAADGLGKICQWCNNRRICGVV